MNKWKKHIPLFAFLIIVVAGFLFRLQGIEKNLSYWNDESHAAFFARQILHHGIPITLTGEVSGIYQIGFYYTTALFFMLFGVTEFAGRLQSVIIGTVVIYLVYHIVKYVTKNAYSALLGAFITAFTQMQLAWSTQLRPYAWLEFFVLSIAYLCIRYLEGNHIIKNKHLLLATGIALIAAFFHGIALVNFILIFSVVVYKSFSEKQYRYFLLAIPLSFLVFILIYFSAGANVSAFISILARVNTDTIHYRVFLRANYDWLLLGAGIGCIYVWFINKKVSILLAGFSWLIILIAWFKINAGYVRYSTPAFPLLYILFACGIGGLTQWLTKISNRSYLYPVIFILLSFLFLNMPIKKDKILLQPRYYYTINGDMRENPIVDYKLAFQKIEKLIEGKKSVIIMDAWNDRVPWYLPNHPYVFLIDNEERLDPTFGEKKMGTIPLYEDEKKKYTSGVVIVENWESLTPYNLQQHIRNTLKHEFDIQNLPYNEADKWGISIYSWGL